MSKSILFHLAGGIGNMIMATPAISSLVNAGETVDLFVEGDSEEAIDLFKNWSLPRVVVDSIVDLPDKGYDFYLISWLAKKPLAIGILDLIHSYSNCHSVVTQT